VRAAPSVIRCGLNTDDIRLANLQAIATQGAIFWLPIRCALRRRCAAVPPQQQASAPQSTLLTIAGVAALLSARHPYPRYFESVTVLTICWAQRSSAGDPVAAQSGRLKGREGQMICALVAGSLVSILAGLRSR